GRCFGENQDPARRAKVVDQGALPHADLRDHTFTRTKSGEPQLALGEHARIAWVGTIGMQADLRRRDDHSEADADEEVFDPYRIGRTPTLASVATRHGVPVGQVGEVAAPRTFCGSGTRGVRHGGSEVKSRVSWEE